MFSLKVQTQKVSSDEISEIIKLGEVQVKFSTTKIDGERDKKNPDYYSKLRNVKISIPNGDGIVIVMGNLECTFCDPWEGHFYIKKIIHETTNFDDVKGVKEDIKFVAPIERSLSNDELESLINQLVNNSDFEYNLEQFSDFMNIFNYYKELSDELNNQKTYLIENRSETYYFLSNKERVDEETFYVPVKNNEGVIIGYKINEVDFGKLKNEVAQKTRHVIDIKILNSNNDYKTINKAGLNNIYLSNFESIDETKSRYMKQLTVFNIVDKEDYIMITGELKNELDYDEEYRFLNLYDMGQKIKVESINNSLKLIENGSTGSASVMLEYLIGDRPMLNNASHRIETIEKQPYLEGLNDSQKEAFLMATDGSPVSLIKGPPGTGKTHVISAIVQYITKELKEKVIISSQTHIAIDNVLDKLMSNRDLIIPNRITNRRNKYGPEEIDKTLYNTWGVNFKNHSKYVENKDLALEIERQMESFKGDKSIRYSEETNSDEYMVIGATTTTSAIAGKKGLETLKGYNWLIIDEVSKCPITEVLRYLPYVDKIIMVGDDYQLSPLLEFSRDDVKGLSCYDEDKFDKLTNIYQKSVFSKVMKKAKEANRLMLLKENYRSTENILSMYNVFYGGELIGMRETVKPNKVQFEASSKYDYQNNDVIFIEVLGGQEVQENTSRYNLKEIEATQFVLEDLLKNTKNPEDVTVSAIFPYAAQISKFQKQNLELINKAKKTFKSFEIDTVDAFQGRETDIVLVNTVVTDSSKPNFLRDFRRINVSLSRARDKLIIFGNKITLSKIQMKVNDADSRCYFKDIIDSISYGCGKMYQYKGVDDYGN